MTGRNDFTNQDKVLDRLKKEWDTHGKLIVAFDFDNTIYDCHKDGLDLQSVILAVGLTHQLGNEVYCFTANNDHDLVRKHSLKMLNFVPKINESSLDKLFDSRKPFYSILLDDRAGLNSALRTLNQINCYIRENK
jgi:hypothetical protein